MYQLELEKIIQVYFPNPKMKGRYLAMLRLLANQARRSAPRE